MTQKGEGMSPAQVILQQQANQSRHCVLDQTMALGHIKMAFSIC